MLFCQTEYITGDIFSSKIFDNELDLTSVLMAYLDATSLHTLPVHFESREPEPASILFPRGPQWTRRYQRTQELDRLDDRFMYKDQGPPMYRLLGAHYNMYKTPPRTDYHSPSRSYHYELRQYNSPNVRYAFVSFLNHSKFFILCPNPFVNIL